jgi:hypothetical protein
MPLVWFRVVDSIRLDRNEMNKVIDYQRRRVNLKMSDKRGTAVLFLSAVVCARRINHRIEFHALPFLFFCSTIAVIML